jgi:hypothetical protein
MRYIIILGAIAIFLLGCVNEDRFGKSNRSEIKTFVIPGQSGSSVINNDSLTVVVTIPETMTDFTLTPSEIGLSNFALVTPEAGQVQDFSAPVEYFVTAEDGSVSVYKVTVLRGGSQPQLDNSSFEDWYTVSVGFSTIEEPGVDKASTIWGTANPGLALGGSSGNTSKQERDNSNYAKMESVAAPALVRMAAATIFIGKFTDGFPSVSDPRSNITLGTPFSARPLSFSFSYTYQPGPNNEDENGDPLSYGDQCDVYLFLENRDGSKVKRVGTAWFRSGMTVSEWSRENITIKYGPLEASDPWFAYAQPIEGEAWGDGTETVTHITILATSSFEGDFFKGSIGSTLELDDIELVYQ